MIKDFGKLEVVEDEEPVHVLLKVVILNLGQELLFIHLLQLVFLN